VVCIGADSDAGWSLLDGFGVWKLCRFGSKRNKQQFGLNPDSEEIGKTGWLHSGPH
jgi:hypothetical protein